jgi:glycine/D-amino acid oxidase-like deaminating enzyme
VAKHEIPCDWRTLSGCHAYMAKNMFEAGLNDVLKLQKSDPELAKLIKVITEDSTNPSLEDLRVPTAAGAFLQEYAASLWPYKLVCWILEDLLASNSSPNESFNLQTNTPVTHLQKATDGSWIVHTARGMIASKKVLLTTNAYTSYLLPEFSDLIVPVRGEMSSLLPPKSMSPASPNKPLEHSYVFLGHGRQNIHQDDYLVQRPFSTSSSITGGELMFGGGRAYARKAGVGVSDDSSIDEPAAAYLRQELNEVLDLQHEDRELKASYEWSGIMGWSRDGRPWVGEVSEELGVGGGKGLWVCAGYTGHGMPNTHLSAKAVVGLMIGKKEEEVDLPCSYRVSRERVLKARDYDEVCTADSKGMVSDLV